MDLSATGYCTKGRSCNDGHASACPLLGTAEQGDTEAQPDGHYDDLFPQPEVCLPERLPAHLLQADHRRLRPPQMGVAPPFVLQAVRNCGGARSGLRVGGLPRLRRVRAQRDAAVAAAAPVVRGDGRGADARAAGHLLRLGLPVHARPKRGLHGAAQLGADAVDALVLVERLRRPLLDGPLVRAAHSALEADTHAHVQTRAANSRAPINGPNLSARGRAPRPQRGHAQSAVDNVPRDGGAPRAARLPKSARLTANAAQEAEDTAVQAARAGAARRRRGRRRRHGQAAQRVGHAAQRAVRRLKRRHLLFRLYRLLRLKRLHRLRLHFCAAASVRAAAGRV
mmetsp:Transcript_16621/g.35286  ORF Transcript_16621/g.35286 Transcript_16621/m.35286 type:complete len:339 (+) Transcript_16621:339-1355(+)